MFLKVVFYLNNENFKNIKFSKESKIKQLRKKIKQSIITTTE
jgi:hypothetical protein